MEHFELIRSLIFIRSYRISQILLYYHLTKISDGGLRFTFLSQLHFYNNYYDTSISRRRITTGAFILAYPFEISKISPKEIKFSLGSHSIPFGCCYSFGHTCTYNQNFPVTTWPYSLHNYYINVLIHSTFYRWKSSVISNRSVDHIKPLSSYLLQLPNRCSLFYNACEPLHISKHT